MNISRVNIAKLLELDEIFKIRTNWMRSKCVTKQVIVVVSTREERKKIDE